MMIRPVFYTLAGCEAAWLLWALGGYWVGASAVMRAPMALPMLALPMVALPVPMDLPVPVFDLIMVAPLVVAVLLFARTPQRWVRMAALGFVVLFGAITADLAISHAIRAHTARELASGRGYFTARQDRALADAIVADDTDRVAALVGSVNVNVQGRGGKTFLKLAIERGASVATVRVLLKAGSDPNQDFGWPLMNALFTRDAALIAALVEAGADASAPDPGGDPLFFPIIDWPDELGWLLDHGVSVDATDSRGWTALMIATIDRQWEAVDVLLAHGARVDVTGADGVTLGALVRRVQAKLHAEGAPVPRQLADLEARLRQGE